MDSEDPKALREELREVEADLAELRRTVAELRRQVGERWLDPTDQVEYGAVIAAADEQEALAEQLEARREELLRLLGEKD
ncbi:MAG: hypothetical protein JWR24_2819 [Actinoallomurus sp.]|jgi:multidrug resistance efflux pump|nr:hypothetical protein [Actinoallomurus sp.]